MTVIVPVGLTIADARKIAKTLGRADLHFIRLSTGRGPRIAPAPSRQARGGQFLFTQRSEQTHAAASAHPGGARRPA